MPPRKALGRGLGALIAPKPETQDKGAREIPVALIDRSPQQPRLHMGEAALKELAASIRQSGVVQPLLLRPKGERYELVAGERRLKAAKLAGLHAVPAIVRSISDEQVLEFAIVENIQRENLSPMEEAQAYRRLADSYSLTQEKIAEKVGKDRATVANTLRLLTLPKKCQDMISEGTLTAGHAKALLSLDDPKAQVALAARIAAEGLSVREAERLCRGGMPLPPKGGPQRTAKAPRPMDPNVRKAQEEMQRALGTKVEVHERRGHKGSVVIHYYSQDELHRLYQRLTRKK